MGLWQPLIQCRNAVRRCSRAVRPTKSLRLVALVFIVEVSPAAANVRGPPPPAAQVKDILDDGQAADASQDGCNVENEALLYHGDTTLAASCCAARFAWSSVEAHGGCGGPEDVARKLAPLCEQAQTLCNGCYRQILSLNERLSKTNVTAANEMLGGEAASLSALTPEELKMRCVPPQMPVECTIEDITLFVLFFGGVALLVASLCLVALFDRKLLPVLVRHFCQRWMMVRFQRTAGTGSASPPSCAAVVGRQTKDAVPPPSPLRLRAPTPKGVPPLNLLQALDGASGAGCSGADLRMAGLEDGQPTTAPGDPFSGSMTMRADLPLENPTQPATAPGDPVSGGPPVRAELPSTEQKDVEGSFDAESATLDFQSSHSLKVQAQKHASMEIQRQMDTAMHGGGNGITTARGSLQFQGLEMDCQESSCEGAPLSPMARWWPARLARVWAFRSVLIIVGWLGVAMRTTHFILCMVSTLYTSVVPVVVELLAVVLPLAWVVLSSRPPLDPNPGVLEGVAYGCCQRVPRFSAFAASIAALEMYSTGTAAQAVVQATCDTTMPRWQLVALYCMGVPVVVMRSYSALLSLRLQDELGRVCKRVLPEVPEEESIDAFDIAIDCDFNSGPTAREESSPAKAISSQKVPASGLQMHLVPWRILVNLGIRLASGNGAEAEGRSLLRPSWRMLLRIGLLVAVIAATTTGLIAVVFAKFTDEPEELESACVTAQNATATCSHFESVGRAWNQEYGDTAEGMANTLQDCCSGCDRLGDCQAWMFEGMAKRCRWIRFVQDPCAKNPGDLNCRCLTHSGITFGFKPTSKIVWLHRDKLL
eukprot:gnl/TRDRNA2_/TRDRNA2_85780_c0_seq1.p1 gnl/TRDRNA2_/TRDRNA2_85780_c0~~gnl/TRDRNA2_/TRDRNA2_85780_c0_seq1.p1  ORF type:complete len:822 (+),score=124.01 gnl/TRDRNA2_/TRDRNA2_85780_c0_seq1:45-2510(+)